MAMIDDDDLAQQFLIYYPAYPSLESIAYRTVSEAVWQPHIQRPRRIYYSDLSIIEEKLRDIMVESPL